MARKQLGAAPTTAQEAATKAYVDSMTQSASADLDFGSVPGQSDVELNIPLPGAAVGECVTLGPPSMTAGIAYTAWVSAPDTVTVCAHNYTTGPKDPPPGKFKAAVVR